MTAPDFSRNGQPPTEYEIELLRAAALEADRNWFEVARQLIANLGPPAGIHALLIVLDTLGTEKVHVPTRHHFLESVYRPVRDREIVRLVEEEKLSYNRAGKRFRMSGDRARQVVERAGRRSPRSRVGKRR